MKSERTKCISFNRTFDISEALRPWTSENPVLSVTCDSNNPRLSVNPVNFSAFVSFREWSAVEYILPFARNHVGPLLNQVELPTVILKFPSLDTTQSNLPARAKPSKPENTKDD